MHEMKKKIWLSPPHMGGSEQEYIKQAFDTNWIAPLGPNVNAFEDSLAEYCNVSHVAALSSGTAALHIALVILGIEREDEVIASTFTFSATVNPIVYQGAIPILVDSEPETWNMSPELLETAIKQRIKKGKKPKAIIPVHLYGMPARIVEIMEISEHYNIPVIEDAAEALGSRFNQKPAGSFGTIGILSFNGNKIITTSGGGALISDVKEYVDKARFLSTQARDSAPHYQHSQIGYNYRMSNVLAGIGLGQMEVINARINKRRENNNFYRKHLESIEGIAFLTEPEETYFSNYWLTTIIINPAETGTTREIIQRELEKENIESRPLWKPMHLQPVFESCPSIINGTSEKLFQNGLCLPSGSSLTDGERDRVMEVLLKNLKR
jgi:dTDP-4-amino-4,6-dideoxygalactose transaminase